MRDEGARGQKLRLDFNAAAESNKALGVMVHWIDNRVPSPPTPLPLNAGEGSVGPVVSHRRRE